MMAPTLAVTNVAKVEGKISASDAAEAAGELLRMRQSQASMAADSGTDVGTVVSKAKRAASSLWLLLHAQVSLVAVCFLPIDWISLCPRVNVNSQRGLLNLVSNNFFRPVDLRVINALIVDAMMQSLFFCTSKLVLLRTVQIVLSCTRDVSSLESCSTITESAVICALDRLEDLDVPNRMSVLCALSLLDRRETFLMAQSQPHRLLWLTRPQVEAESPLLPFH